MEVCTVDGFQGREKDIVIISCVRGGADYVRKYNPKQGEFNFVFDYKEYYFFNFNFQNILGIGFVSDVRRMNVALTRGRHCVWVIGDSRALYKSKDWSALIERNDYHIIIIISLYYSNFYLLSILTASLVKTSLKKKKKKTRKRNSVTSGI